MRKSSTCALDHFLGRTIVSKLNRTPVWFKVIVESHQSSKSKSTASQANSRTSAIHGILTGISQKIPLYLGIGLKVMNASLSRRFQVSIPEGDHFCGVLSY
jgi:hypothetical protein